MPIRDPTTGFHARPSLLSDFDHSGRRCALAVVLLVSVATAWAADADPLAPTRERLQADFDRHLADPPAYDRLVARECRQFPEGTLYPFALPALAYANLGIASGKREWARERVRILIHLALPHVTAQVQPPHGDLAHLERYEKQATFLSMTACMLGCYRLLGGDDRYEPVDAAISGSLARALLAADGATIESYPTYSWTFDTMASLLALQLRDATTGTSTARPLLTRHLAWLDAHATDARSKLPFSKQSTPGVGGDAPRGCDLSMRVCLLAQLDRTASRALFDRYLASFWSDRGNLAGFREWPVGHADTTDFDSGPILEGIGATASGVGIGSCLAAGDLAKARRLADELAAVDALRRMLQLVDPGMAKRALGTNATDARYVTGFLYGDATLFYAVTWTDWKLQAP